MAAATPLRVLVVDDERLIADTLAMILQTRGHEARAVYSGEAAMILAKTFVPDVLIIDIVMPEMDGTELAENFAHLFPACKVLLMSGNAMILRLLDQMRDKGQDITFLQKPVHPSVVLNVVESLARIA